MVHSILPIINTTKTIDNVLNDRPILSLPQTPIAEASRPHRAFKEQHHPDGTGPGRKRLHDAVTATRVNWQNPLLWPTIVRAVNITGFDMSPVEIAHTVKALDPISLKDLTPQVIGRWIDRSGMKPTWKYS